MGTPDNKVSGFVDIVKSWIPRRSEPSNLSRDFWMPDHSCRVCYECDSQFTVFNRRHHCRLCGRVFCAKCAANSIPAPSDEFKAGNEELERIRVCNYCFKQREQGVVSVDNGTSVPSLGLSPSPSATSLASTKSSYTCNSGSSTVGSTPYATGPYKRVQYNSGDNPYQSAEKDSVTTEQDIATSHRSTDPSGHLLDSSLNDVNFFVNRSDDEDDVYGVYHSHYLQPFSQANDYYGAVTFNEMDHVYGPHEAHTDGETIKSKTLSFSPPSQDFDASDAAKTNKLGEESDAIDYGNVCEPPYGESDDTEPVDFENNEPLWLPPEPEDEDDEREAVMFDDDDDEGTQGEWGYFRSSNSFGSGEYRTRDKSSEEHRRAMKNVVEGHFRALVAQLLQVENLPMDDESDRENWLDIITSLSWEGASLLKPDTSKGGGMDPGGYVKVKCIPCGYRSQSTVVKGVVCKKNVAHRRMTSKVDKPRFLILGGSLEYQRVSNQLSSFETLLQQEMDHLKMAVAKIDAHHPDVLLVEKSVSRHAQEYLLAKDISLVLNIKRPLLERIARCTGAQIVPSIDHLTSPKLGYCDMFHVEKFIEEHGGTGHGGRKLMKTLMFFEGCPKPLGCTILLKGAHEGELKKVKHVVQYGVFAAYHLALETSFLADEGASLPELPLKSPINVALPDKPSSIDRSISTIPGFSVPNAGKATVPEPSSEPCKSSKDLITYNLSSFKTDSIKKLEEIGATGSSEGLHCQTMTPLSLKSSVGTAKFSNPLSQSDNISCKPSVNFASEDDVKVSAISNLVSSNTEEAMVLKNPWFGPLEAMEKGIDGTHGDENAFVGDHVDNKHGSGAIKQDGNRNKEVESSKEAFPPSSDNQSILVSLSTRSIWKGTVCERAHLLRIKYYGSFDKPLGRFLRDHLFDQDYRCRSCDMPSEAHVHCYTHRQGSLTISVKKFPEFLPGEQEGKIWMWHRCLRCPRTNGFPPATRRIVMSDAAWGLSFGKFLELSFSNHAAASRVASCGHSLHRDCLRFYGFGRMVACFRYASINVHSVYLPPPKVEFKCDDQEWIQYEAKEVRYKAEVFYTEVQDAIRKIADEVVDSVSQTSELRVFLADLERILHKDKEDFQESLQQILNVELKAEQPKVDILEINKLRRQILFKSYAWDECLIRAASIVKNNVPGALSPRLEGLVNSMEQLAYLSEAFKASKDFNSQDSFLQEAQRDINPNQVKNAGDINDSTSICKEMGTERDLNSRKEAELFPASTAKIGKENPLESSQTVQRALLDGAFPVMSNLSDTLDVACADLRGQENGTSIPDLTSHGSENVMNTSKLNQNQERGNQAGVEQYLCPAISNKGPINEENSMKFWVPSPSLYTSLNKNSSLNSQKQVITESNPVYVSSYRELEVEDGARLLLPVGVSDIVVPVYDDEPTSIIAYALVSSDYYAQMSESDKSKNPLESVGSFSLLDSVNLLSLSTFSDVSFDVSRSLGSADEPRVLQLLDPSLYLKDLHARVSFVDEGPLGKVKFTVTCYYAKRFEALRKSCCPSELDFIRSLSRCKKWGAQGGKSNAFFAKTLDDRFIVKQVSKTELESFIKFGPDYFKYLSESISSKSPTCLAKILGIYQVSSKHLKGGKESKMDVLVMENLLFRRNVTRLYDLKGSFRSRYNPDTSGNNKVLLDQNLIEAMPTSPIFVGSKAKRLLERAVWNDTSFLASIDVMDYSLLVGVDEERHELVLGIIDFMRQYTWDKHLETWVKTSGILGGPRNASPTVISPQQYKKRFRKAMTTYFLMVPDQWSPPTIIPSNSQTELNEEKENPQGAAATS